MRSGRVQGRRRAAGHRGDRRGPAQGARGQDQDHLHVALPQRRHVLAHEGLALFVRSCNRRPSTSCRGPRRRGVHSLTSVLYFVCLCELCRISLAFSPESLATKPSGECSLHSSFLHIFFSIVHSISTAFVDKICRVFAFPIEAVNFSKT